MNKKTTYTRHCNRCERFFETNGKYAKTCLNCDTRYKNQQIKKDEDLIGKSSGNTKHKSGRNNNLKDWDADNQSADKDHLTNPMLDIVSRNDGGRLKLSEVIE